MFLVGFCLCFCFIPWRFAPESVRKNSLDLRPVVFWVRSLFFFVSSLSSFFAVFCFCFFKRDSSGGNRTPPHTHLFCWFLSFLCPAAFVCFARFGRASCFLVVSRGAILGPVRFWDSLDLLRFFSWDARRQGFSWASLALFSFFPLCVVLRPHLF